MPPEPPSGAVTSAALADGARSVGNRFGRNLLVPALALVGIVALVAFGVTATPGFLTVDNLLNVLRAAAIIGTVALGMTFVTITGNFFSLSVAQTAAFAAVAFAGLLAAGIWLPLAVLAVLALSVVWGIVQGALVGRGANPIITTLGG